MELKTIHFAKQDAGKMPCCEYEMRVLVARQEITGADRQWAAQYEPGDVVRYTRGSKTHGIEAGDSCDAGSSATSRESRVCP